MMDGPTSFFWHDYETFGRDPRRDLPAQFAGLRTDLDLNPIDEPVDWYCQPPRDRLPDPESCLLTGITPQRCAEAGLTPRDFAHTIHAQFQRPGTVAVGYNTLAFDDEVSRHLFWRNLIDPYARERGEGRGRWDLLPLVRAAWALRPAGIEWPVKADGRPSFRLEDLAAANGLAHEQAHDARFDVHATLALARRLRGANARLFSHAFALRDKGAAAAEVDQGRPFLHVSGRYGTEHGCTAMVWSLAPHPAHANERIVWDLRHDPAELLDLDVAMIRRRLFTRREELEAEGLVRLPIKTLNLGKAPFVTSKLSVLDAGRAEAFALDPERALQHARWAWRHRDALAQIGWAEVYAREASAERDVDAALYGGDFIRGRDRRLLDELQGLDGPALARRRLAFDDGRLEELVFRYRARNFPDSLDAADQERWQQHVQARLFGEGPDGTPAEGSIGWYESRLAELADTLDAQAELSDDPAQRERIASRRDLVDELAEWGHTLVE